MVDKCSHKKILLLDLTTYVNLNTTERNAYSFLVSLMLKKNNNIIYNASNKRLSDLTGIHRNSINNYIRILLERSYIKFIGPDLHINKFDKKTKLYNFKLYRSLSAKNVKELIEIEILRLHINRQIFAIQLKNDIRLNRTKMTNKRLKNNANLLHGVFNRDVHFSMRYAANKLNVSIYKIQDLLKSASENKLINTEPVYKFICKLSNFKEFLCFKTNLNKNSETFYNLRYDFKTNKVFNLIGTDIKFRLNCH